MTESPIEVEHERAYDRDELAAVFREFATALDDDRPLRIDDGEQIATVSIPSRVVAEFEAERETEDEPPVAELEIELEWDDSEGETMHLKESERDSPAVLPETDAEESESETASTAGEEADEDRDGGRTSRYEVYEDKAGQWRWRLVHWNGNIVADSGEGYSSRSNAKRAVRGVMRSAPTASIDVLE